MSLLAILIIALGLSTDAFAVAVARGAAGKVGGTLSALRAGAVFGSCEAGMAVIGFLLASRFADWVTGVDHWIALILLGTVGGHMLWESFKNEDIEGESTPQRETGFLGNVITALGTSIDAAAIGVALALVNTNIWLAAAIIGTMSFSMSTIGLLIGPRVGAYLGRRAETAGGLVLILIGIYIFYSHVAGAGELHGLGD